MKTASFGSISSGTLRPADLIDALSGELASLVEGAEHKDLLASCSAWEDFDEENADPAATESHESEGDELIADLSDALQEAAPAYAYFGANEGDGADFGFWLSSDFESEFDGLKVDDTAEVPADYAGEVLHVNDHGNCTLYAKDEGATELREIWALV